MSIDRNQYKQILLKKFPNGFRINSKIEQNRFKEEWKRQFENVPVEDDETIIKKIKEITIPYNNFVYLPEMLCSKEVQKEIMAYIENCFLEGRCVYFDILYDKFRDQFQAINNVEMLKALFQYFNDACYCIYGNGSYISCKENAIKNNTTEEIKQYFISCGEPVNLTTVCENLVHIPSSVILKIVCSNNKLGFIRNRKGEYFHIDLIHLDEEDLNHLVEVLKTKIQRNTFITEEELIEILRQKYPQLEEHYSYLTPMGIREVMKYKLQEQFSFKGTIISQKGEAISVRDIYTNYIKKHPDFTIKELKYVRNELKVNPNFNLIYQFSIRTGEKNFVDKQKIDFDIEKTDKAIDDFCSGDYITIAQVTHFSGFPYFETGWNKFLLEQYVYQYSSKYKLIHKGFEMTKAVGVITKKTSGYNNLDEIMIDALANSNILLTEEKAIQYLWDNGFLARRRDSSVKYIVEKAKKSRLQKG